MAPVGSKREFDNDFNPYAAPDAGGYASNEMDADPSMFVYAGFFRRFAAAFLDGIIMNVVGLGMGIAFGIMIVSTGMDPENPVANIVLSILSMVAGIGYEAGMTSSSYQATLGKMALGMKVTDIHGQRFGFTRAVGRLFAKIPSAMILMIGYLIQPFTEKKQALHDILAGTLVVRTR